MFIRKENVDEVLKTANENCKNYNIQDSFGVLMMISYNTLLDNIAKKNNYKEGEAISEDDLKAIQKNVKDVIDNVASQTKSNQEKKFVMDKMYFSGYDTLMAANDYLYALAMKKLGCPDIPTSFGSDVVSNIQNTAKRLDATVKQSYYDHEYSTKTYFDKQRKKDADEVRFKNKSLIQAFNTSLGSVNQLAELVAEYQALKLRQDGHNGFWRFFHRGENKERMQLLEDMKSAIGKAVGNDVSLDPNEKTPADIANLLNNKMIDKKAKDALKSEKFAERCKCEDKISNEKLPKENQVVEQPNNVIENVIENDKRVVVEFKDGEFNELDGAKIEPAVSEESVNKNEQLLDK